MFMTGCVVLVVMTKTSQTMSYLH